LQQFIRSNMAGDYKLPNEDIVIECQTLGPHFFKGW